ncbi:MAG: NusG domain II-containing protein [Rhodocyclaceae bacterium]|nr:NusG domain II-containing protein [Rhodocyclaceae bacterium]
MRFCPPPKTPLRDVLPPGGEETLGAARRASSWLALLRPGDWATILFAAFAVAASFPLFWAGGQAERAVVRLDGRVVAEFPLAAPRRYTVTGPLGDTVIEIAPGRARVLSDPGPRQYCVQQGWLTRSNAIAICAPNHVSLSLSGRDPSHDSINY